VLSSGGQSSTSGGRSTSSAAQPSDEYEQTLQRFLSEQHQRGASAVEAGSQGAAAEEALKVRGCLLHCRNSDIVVCTIEACFGA
jgi:hypothetical protein